MKTRAAPAFRGRRTRKAKDALAGGGVATPAPVVSARKVSEGVKAALPAIMEAKEKAGGGGIDVEIPWALSQVTDFMSRTEGKKATVRDFMAYQAREGMLDSAPGTVNRMAREIFRRRNNKGKTGDFLRKYANSLKDGATTMSEAMDVAAGKEAQEEFGFADRYSLSNIAPISPGDRASEDGVRYSLTSPEDTHEYKVVGMALDEKATSDEMRALVGIKTKDDLTVDEVGKCLASHWRRHIPGRFFSVDEKTGKRYFDKTKPGAREYLAGVMAHEGIARLDSGEPEEFSPVGWYAGRIKTAFRILSRIFPAMADFNSDDTIAFSLAMAFDSQGVKVLHNLRYAVKDYKYFKKHGKFNTDPSVFKQGMKYKAIQSNFAKVNHMMTVKHMSLREIDEALQVARNNAEWKRLGFDFSSWIKDHGGVYFSNVFGGKIGGAFLSNIRGHYEVPTIDMWMVRMLNRITGEYHNASKGNQQKAEGILEKFRGLITRENFGKFTTASGKVIPVKLEKGMTYNTVVNGDARLRRYARLVLDMYAREHDGKTYDKEYATPLSKMAKAYFDAQELSENVSASDRSAIAGIMGKACDIIEEETGKRLHVSDLQAILWYNEKNLYDKIQRQARDTLGVAFDSAAATAVAEMQIKGDIGKWSEYTTEEKERIQNAADRIFAEDREAQRSIGEGVQRKGSEGNGGGGYSGESHTTPGSVLIRESDAGPESGSPGDAGENESGESGRALGARDVDEGPDVRVPVGRGYPRSRQKRFSQFRQKIGIWQGSEFGVKFGKTLLNPLGLAERLGKLGFPEFHYTDIIEIPRAISSFVFDKSNYVTATTQLLRVADSSAKAFVALLKANKASHGAEGERVTVHTPQYYTDSKHPYDMYVSADGSYVFAIGGDGDIVSVCADAKFRYTPNAIIPMAVALGGDHLDCYGDGLADLYSKYGFIPAARIAFDKKYMTKAWKKHIDELGTPDLVFMYFDPEAAKANPGRDPVYVDDYKDNVPYIEGTKDDYAAGRKAAMDAAERVRADDGARFSISSSIEETDRMIAWHNISSSALGEAIELGGFAMPSFAVKRADSVHKDYGDISVIASKSSITPGRDQVIYGGDAWTPVFPAVHYKINEKASRALSRRIEGLLKKAGTQAADFNLAVDKDNLEDAFNRGEGLDGRNDGLRLAFLEDTGRHIDVPRMEKAYSIPIAAIRHIAKKYGDLFTRGSDAVMAVEPEIRKYLYEYTLKNGPQKKAPNGKTYAELSAKRQFGDAISFNKLDRIFNDVHQVMTYGVQSVLDVVKLEKQLNAAMRGDGIQAEYREWLADLSKDLVEKKGIRNEKDVFTSAGNRRSWDSLHYAYNLANVVRGMKKEPKQGRAQAFSGAGSVKGAALKSFGSIDEVREELGRLVPEFDEKSKVAYDKFSDDTLNLANKVADDPFTGSNILAEVLSAAKTVPAIERYLKREYRFLATEDGLDLSALAQEIYDLGQEANTLPMKYFEAKTYRAFPLQEAAGIVVPDDLDKKLVDELQRKGANVLTYESGNESDRLEKVNSIPDVRFSITSTRPWPADFPKATIHTTLGNVRAKGDLHARAKAGDRAAAIELVKAVVKRDRLRAMAARHPGAIVAYPHAEESTGRNKIPAMLANTLVEEGKKEGLELDDSIVQTVRAGHTGASRLGRFFSRTAFDGKVERGREYILVDDHLTQGGTLSELRHYIENNGGHVVDIMTLTASMFSTTIAPSAETLAALREKFDEKELLQILRENNVAGSLDALTEREARLLLEAVSLDAIRDRGLEARQARDERLGEGSTQGLVGGPVNGDTGTIADALPEELRRAANSVISETAGTPDYMTEPDGTLTEKSELQWLLEEASRKHNASNPDIRYSVSRDSEGNELSEEQAEFFRDSKISGYEYGALVPMYHATTREKFTVFDREKLGYNTLDTGANTGMQATSMIGFWFNTQDLSKKRSGYSVNDAWSHRVYLNITEPYEVANLNELADKIMEVYGDAHPENEGFDYETTDDPEIAVEAGKLFVGWLRENGYDGVLVWHDNEFGGASCAALDPGQIKKTDNRNPTGNPDIRYSVTAEEADRQLAKVRPDLSAEDRRARVTALYAAEPPDGVTKNKFRLSVLHWMVHGDTRLPEDMPSVEAALRVANNKHVNPMSYDTPQALVNQFRDVSVREGAALLDPDAVPEFTDKEDRGDGVVVYTVNDTKAGQKAVRDVLNNNYGKDFDCWCLVYGNEHGGLSTKAWGYWKHYNKTPKKIAFQDGRAVAFQADDTGEGLALHLRVLSP